MWKNNSKSWVIKEKQDEINESTHTHTQQREQRCNSHSYCWPLHNSSTALLEWMSALVLAAAGSAVTWGETAISPLNSLPPKIFLISSCTEHGSFPSGKLSSLIPKLLLLQSATQSILHYPKGNTGGNMFSDHEDIGTVFIQGYGSFSFLINITSPAMGIQCISRCNHNTICHPHSYQYGKVKSSTYHLTTCTLWEISHYEVQISSKIFFSFDHGKKYMFDL